MATSRRFKLLVRRLESLRAHLLPAQFSPVGQYTDREHDLARGYLVLVHAEIEAYCEDRTRGVAAKAHARWSQKNTCGRILVRLVRFHDISNRQPWRVIDKSPGKIQSAVNSYLGSIGQNHGVKEENLYKMLYPIGIEADDLDNVWLAIMNSFGTTRGNVAHSSISTQQPIDPATEYQRITNQILPGLRKLDR
jgi:hypothetical protein